MDVLLLVLLMAFGVLLGSALWVEFRVRQEPGLTRLNEALKLDAKRLARWHLARGADASVESKELALLLLEEGVDADETFDWAVSEGKVFWVEGCLEFDLPRIKKIVDRDFLKYGSCPHERAWSTDMVATLEPLELEPHLAEVLVSHGADHLAVNLAGESTLHTVRRREVLEYLLTLPGSTEIVTDAAKGNDVLAELLDDVAQPFP
ncbi:MAG: hypothetical protein ACI8XO_002093 [Verrucomicrobiales bacterium]|jgi:hypothetical protein